ncbi:ABC transporter substrate-binding protein [Pseudomarimonas salicorniae]|uniref:ABC transporter substrate-binding protein n=1 Tax=Pseudomarimonas salicorniae TaxID=2933270 RepID=A0ABT0GCM9_9GAMM|nr:ABC transporter substrate-binding protein [Lysobacter sp. CAU 1642]MCK7592285.1 ABC transporter substrate-binding protein [Lysobacter sp. CAU 1642]
MGELPTRRRDFLRQAGLGALGACLPAGIAGARVRGDTLHIRAIVGFKTLDPPMMVSGQEGLVAKAIYSNLLRFKPGRSWDWELDAAEHFEQVDETHFAFRLRPGLMFSHGFGEITADDVKFSLERAIAPALAAPNANDMGTFSHVEVEGRYSGTLVLKSPYAAFIPIGLCAVTGTILSRKAMESVGGRFIMQPPCSSGPYRFARWRAQRRLVLERNPDWTGEPAEFSEIHLYPLTDIKAAEFAYEAGELDCTQVAIETVEVFRRSMPQNSRLDVFDSLRYYWIGLNQEHPTLQDRRVRRAIQYAIDVEAVIKAAWFGLAEPATGIIAPGLIGHRAAADIPPRGDREMARRLLAEAGVELPLKLTLSCRANPLELTAAQVVQWSLAKVGIEIELDPQDNATLITMGMESAGERWRDLQMHLQSFSMLGDPYYATAWFVSKQVGIWNWERFRSAEFDRLHRQALAVSDPAVRDPLYQRMQHLMEDSGCYRFLAHGVEAMLSRRTIQPAYRADGYPLYRSFRRLDPPQG